MKFGDWFEFVDNAGLSVAEFRVLMFLGMQQAARQEPFSMSIRIVAKKCRANVKTVAKCIDSLQSKHLIEVSAINGQSSIYRLPVDYTEFYGNHAISCAYCGSTTNLTIDHAIPKSRGGSNSPQNLIHACQKCNCIKGNRTAEEWRIAQ